MFIIGMTILYLILGIFGCIVRNSFPMIFSLNYLEYAGIVLLQVIGCTCGWVFLYGCLCGEGDN